MTFWQPSSAAIVMMLMPAAPPPAMMVLSRGLTPSLMVMSAMARIIRSDARLRMRKAASSTLRPMRPATVAMALRAASTSSVMRPPRK